MYSTKSFCNVLAFASNEPGVVSPIGELTTFAQTFTKELGFYYHSTIRGYELLNFSSDVDGTKQSIPQVNVDQGVALVDMLVRLTLGTSGELYFDEVLLQLKTAAEAINATAVDMGAMVTANGRWVPEWISWTDATTADTNNTHKVWLALDSFKVQYTDFEIVVVPPFDDVDYFFNPGSLVESRVKAITPTQMMEAIDTAKVGNPETLARTDPYQYCDPVNATRKLDVYWSVIIYGPAGNDPDVIRESLVDYILSKSTHTRDEWAVLFPDIFKRTEFIFAPLWNNYAAEQRVFDYGVYSPILDHGQPVDWLKQYADGYPSDHIISNAQVMGFPYRSMQMAVIGHIENRDGKMKITDYYPDFINVGTDSTDFGRMTLDTQTWAKTMMPLVTAAEALDSSTDLPKGTYRVVRNGVTYVARSYNRVLLLVLAKSNAIPAPTAAPTPAP